MTGEVKKLEAGISGHLQIIAFMYRRDKDGYFGPGIKVQLLLDQKLWSVEVWLLVKILTTLVCGHHTLATHFAKLKMTLMDINCNILRDRCDWCV